MNEVQTRIIFRCDGKGCSEWEPFIYSTGAEASDAARKAGWTLEGDRCWCPTCSEAALSGTDEAMGTEARSARRQGIEAERDALVTALADAELQVYEQSARFVRVESLWRSACEKVAEADRTIGPLVAALSAIRCEGAVCPDFELCDHAGCNSSYTSWHLANEALKTGAGETFLTRLRAVENLLYGLPEWVALQVRGFVVPAALLGDTDRAQSLDAIAEPLADALRRYIYTNIGVIYGTKDPNDRT